MTEFKNTNEKKATASLILGIISATPLIFFLVSILLAVIAPGFMYYDATRGQSILVLYSGITTFYFYPISFLSGLAGIILGKFGLRSTKKNLSIIGIVLSILGIVTPIMWTF